MSNYYPSFIIPHVLNLGHSYWFTHTFRDSINWNFRKKVLSYLKIHAQTHKIESNKPISLHATQFTKKFPTHYSALYNSHKVSHWKNPFHNSHLNNSQYQHCDTFFNANISSHFSIKSCFNIIAIDVDADTRCRVDFQRTPTKNCRINLSVLGEYERLFNVSFNLFYPFCV